MKYTHKNLKWSLKFGVNSTVYNIPYNNQTYNNHIFSGRKNGEKQ